MPDLIKTFQDATNLQCEFIEKLLDLDMVEVTRFADSLVSFLRETSDNRFVYGIAAGRSALSLYSFLQLLQNHFDNVFPCTLEDPLQRHFSKRMNNMAIAISGSGETPSVNNYIENIISRNCELKLITANKDGTAHRLVEDYKNGSILEIKGKTKYSTDMGRKSRLSPLGTEFELEVLAFLNAAFKEIESRLAGNSDGACRQYRIAIQDFAENGRLIGAMNPETLERWFGRLFPRSGRYIIGGVGRSGLVARAFEMRFTHLNKNSYWERDFNAPCFQIGDVYIPISGSGNNYEILEGTVNALKNGSDVMPITANRSSKLVSLMRDVGRLDDIIFIPVKSEQMSLFSGNASTTSWLVSEYTKFRYPIFEINTSIFTNSVVAAGAEFLGIEEAGMRRLHG
jgi:D-arabinose 5-phosphate isomerase GutQ